MACLRLAAGLPLDFKVFAFLPGEGVPLLFGLPLLVRVVFLGLLLEVSLLEVAVAVVVLAVEVFVVVVVLGCESLAVAAVIKATTDIA